jgi:hypothetical protein
MRQGKSENLIAVSFCIRSLVTFFIVLPSIKEPTSKAETFSSVYNDLAIRVDFIEPQIRGLGDAGDRSTELAFERLLDACLICQGGQAERGSDDANGTNFIYIWFLRVEVRVFQKAPIA